MTLSPDHQPPPPPGPEFVAWALRKNQAYTKRRKVYLNACIRAGLLPHMNAASYPEVEVEVTFLSGLILDPLLAHDG